MDKDSFNLEFHTIPHLEVCLYPQHKLLLKSSNLQSWMSRGVSSMMCHSTQLWKMRSTLTSSKWPYCPSSSTWHWSRLQAKLCRWQNSLPWETEVCLCCLNEVCSNWYWQDLCLLAPTYLSRSLFGRNSWSMPQSPQVLNLPLLSFSILPILRLTLDGMEQHRVSSYWNEDVQKLEELLPVNQHYSSGLKKLMLKAQFSHWNVWQMWLQLIPTMLQKVIHPWTIKLLTFSSSLLLLSITREISSLKKNHHLQHAINYLGQDYDPLAGPFPGSMLIVPLMLWSAQNFPAAIQISATFQEPPAFKEPVMPLHPSWTMECPAQGSSRHSQEIWLQG